MGSMSKWKHFISFPFIILLTTLLFLISNNLFLTINYRELLQDDSQNITSQLKALRKPNWFEVVREIKNERIERGVATVGHIRNDEFHAHIGKNTTTYLKEVKNPEWFEIVRGQITGNEAINVGLVNIEETAMDKVFDTNVQIVKVQFTPIGYHEIPWPELSPERMDEHSKCPDIPMPRFEDYQDLDVLVARVPPCQECEMGVMRDASRLQLNLVVANLLVRSGRPGDKPVFAVFLDSCDPMLEIFRCEDLLWNENNSWIYNPELTRIKQLMLMPVGPCQFVPPFSKFGDREAWTTRHIETIRQMGTKQAYVTVLHTSEDYVCGAIVLVQSIIQSNSTKDLILLADSNISPASIQALRAAGWKTRRIKRIRSPYSRANTYNEWNYSKLRIWQLKRKKYDKLMFIDADLIVNRNLDEFFAYPEMTAAGNYQRHLFNSGLMLVEPSECRFQTLIKKMAVVESYNGGDQGFLNEMFAWWHRLPPQTNYLKVFVDPDDHQHWVDEHVYAVHYTGLKPWKCREEEHDCNWDTAEFRRYASNSAHKMWWKVYRRMPERLRQYCGELGLENDGNENTTSLARVHPLGN